jgi:predicted DNA-binding transcriptional regulator AlpA
LEVYQVLLRENEAAKYLGMSISWMQRSRWDGSGPPFIKINHAVRYRQSDLEDWVEKRIQNSTSHKKDL